MFKSKKQKRIDKWVKDFKRTLEKRVENLTEDEIDVAARHLYVDIAHSYNSPSKIMRALEESVKLQSHYATLLNTHDGGNRLVFNSTMEWMDRIDQINKIEQSTYDEDFDGR